MTPCGTGGFLPDALRRLLDPDPAVREAGAVEALISHQNTIYEATVPVARFVAAILNDPATETGEDDAAAHAGASRRPTRAVLLDWLSSTAYDADDATLAARERRFDGRYLAV